MSGARSIKTNQRLKQDVPDLALGRFLPYQLSVVAESLSRVFARRYEREFGLSVPEWRVIAVLAECGAVATQDIIERTQMDPVRVSRAAIRLADKSLVTRKTNPKDQRAHVLTLTAKGLGVYRNIVPLARDLEAGLMQGLTDAERRQLEHILSKIHARAKAIDES